MLTYRLKSSLSLPCTYGDDPVTSGTVGCGSKSSRTHGDALTAKRSRYELRSWTFYSMEMKTAYKAAMRRGAILKVNPQYTSQKCPGCGTIDKTARDRSQHRYMCKHCGLVYNDDEVAAKNLRQLGIWYVSGVDNPHFSKKVSGY